MVQWSRRHDSSAEGAGSISGQETKILHATARKKNKIGPLRTKNNLTIEGWAKQCLHLLLEIQVESRDFVDFFFFGMLWHSRPVLNISTLYLKGLFSYNPSLNSVAYRTAGSTSPGSLLETNMLGHAGSLALPTESESVF